MAFFVFLAVLAYLFIGVIILMVVSIDGKKKRIWATVTALVLIPTWDVLLAFLVFPSIWPNLPHSVPIIVIKELKLEELFFSLTCLHPIVPLVPLKSMR